MFLCCFMWSLTTHFLPPNWQELVNASENLEPEETIELEKIWSSQTMDEPIEDSISMENSTTPDEAPPTPTKTNQSTSMPDELFMPTMPDLDSLTCRRSSRQTKAPDRYDPSSFSTYQSSNESSDYWETSKDGNTTIWTRHHLKPRKALFSPEDSKGGPKLSNLQPKRATKVLFDGISHKVIDDIWTEPQNNRELLDQKWTGTTTFWEKPLQSRRKSSLFTMMCLVSTTIWDPGIHASIHCSLVYHTQMINQLFDGT